MTIVFFKFVFASKKKRNNKITFLITVLQYCKLPPYMSQLFSKPSILIHFKKKGKNRRCEVFSMSSPFIPFLEKVQHSAIFQKLDWTGLDVFIRAVLKTYPLNDELKR